MPAADENPVRTKALNLIALARKPPLIPAGSNLVRDDTATANREATLALAAAMVYLADTLRGAGPLDDSTGPEPAPLVDFTSFESADRP